MYENSSSRNWVTQGSERLSDAHSHTASNVRPGITPSPSDSKSFMHSFHYTRGSQPNCLPESRGNNVSTDSWAPYQIYWIRIYTGQGGWQVCLGIYFKSLQGQPDDQPGVGILHCVHSTLTLPPEEQESGDERGNCSIIHGAVVFRVCWRTNALG